MLQGQDIFDSPPLCQHRVPKPRVYMVMCMLMPQAFCMSTVIQSSQCKTDYTKRTNHVGQLSQDDAMCRPHIANDTLTREDRMWVAHGLELAASIRTRHAHDMWACWKHMNSTWVDILPDHISDSYGPKTHATLNGLEFVDIYIYICVNPQA